MIVQKDNLTDIIDSVQDRTITSDNVNVDYSVLNNKGELIQLSNETRNNILKK
jgi:hypothetical protein